MAKYGLKKLYWAKMDTETDSAAPTYTGGKQICKIVSLNVAITNAEGEFYADDALAEYGSEFSSAELTAEGDYLSLADKAAMEGGTYSESDGFSSKVDDTAPYGGYAGYQVLMVNNTKKYRGWFYAKAKAIATDFDGTTKNDSISFATEPVKAKVVAPKYGPWRKMKEFDTETAADTWCQTQVGITTPEPDPEGDPEGDHEGDPEGT